MKLEKLVLTVGGSSMLLGCTLGVIGWVAARPTLTLIGICALGFGAFVGFIPLFWLLGTLLFARKGE